MQNIEIKVEDNIMAIIVDLSKDFGPSKSGKTISIASTKGNQKVTGPDGDVIVGVNVYKYPSE